MGDSVSRPGNVVDSHPDLDEIFSQRYVDYQRKDEKKRDEPWDQAKFLASMQRFGILNDKGSLPTAVTTRC